jgi:hypothetical protein
VAEPAVPAGVNASAHDQHAAAEQRDSAPADAGPHGPALPVRAWTRSRSPTRTWIFRSGWGPGADSARPCLSG